MYKQYYAKCFEIDEDRIITQFMDWITEFIEGDASLGLDQQVVLAGRQPSLHRFSVRAFYVKIVQSKAIQIHPLSCKGYNADFDGDTMWLVALLTEEAKKEAIELAVAAGAVRKTVEIIEMEDVPLAYYPGNTNRVKIKAAGDLS